MRNIKNIKNIPEVNQIPAQVFDQFQKAEPKFLIVGIRKQPQTGQYQFHSFHVPTNEQLLISCAADEMVRFKVFNVGVDQENEAMLRAKGKEFIKEQTEKAEYEHYLKLHEKYSKSMKKETQAEVSE